MTPDSSLWKILKALTFDGGPSSTRFGYLTTVVTVCFSLVVIVVSLFVITVRHEVNLGLVGIIAGLVIPIVTALLGFATNAQNKKNAQSSDSSPIDSPPVPQNPPQEVK